MPENFHPARLLIFQKIFPLARLFHPAHLMFSKNFKKNIKLVSKIGGVILLITGILIITNQLQALGYYLLDLFPFLQKFG